MSTAFFVVVNEAVQYANLWRKVRHGSLKNLQKQGIFVIYYNGLFG